MSSIPALVERVVLALAGLVALGETIDDEWTYVHDLETVWVARLRAVAAARAELPPDSGLEPALARLIDEVGRISDPHRAIDWLSTLPQATLVAIGEPAW